MTVSFARDLHRFGLLRHSLALFAPEVPHDTYVDTEDLPLFRELYGGQEGLTILPSAAVLPRAVEAARRRWRGWRGRALERAGRRVGLRPNLSGWKIQQVIKLAALPRTGAEAVVFLDSDVVLCAPVEEGTFWREERLRLLETPARTAEDFAYEACHHALLDGRMERALTAHNYVHTPPRFLVRTGQRLLALLEARHEDWPRTFLGREQPSEYMLLGHVAREAEGYEGYLPEPSDPAGWAYTVTEGARLAETLELCRREGGRRGFLLIQSNLGFATRTYGGEVRNLIEALAAAPASRPPALASAALDAPGASG